MAGDEEALGATTPADTADTEVDGAALAGTAPASISPGLGGEIRVMLPEGIGRYVPIEILGSGGMGIVYRARDPELDRDVAVKLLRPGPFGRASGTEGRARLLREARAMARVRHPNVITVHDVGAIGDQLFVAMELITGAHLGAWLDARTRSWQDIVATLTDAGNGLVAAHAAGLAHRDFKPENVLIDDDGGVLVTDFGLARDLAQDTDAAPVPASISSTSDSLTRTGAIMGTPLYMSPEQHLGEVADERSDQFSFCVTFYAALYGQHPFSTHSASELRRDVLAGTVRAPPDNSDVPAWLFPLLERGMRPEPADRHPSIQALLDAISARMRPRRRRLPFIAAVLGIAAVATAAAIFFARRGGEPPAARCDDSRIQLASIWDDARKQQVRATLAAGGTEVHRDTAARVTAILDAYADRWVESYDGACRAAQVEHTLSPADFEVRSSCYQDLRRKLAALTDVLSEPDDVLVMSAVRAAAAMPPIDTCETAAGTARLISSATPLAEEAMVLHERSMALSNVGRLDHAVEAAVQAVAVARRAGDDAVLAQTLVMLGMLYLDVDGLGPGQRSLEEAIEVARRLDDQHTLATAAVALAYLHGIYVMRPARALQWADVAREAIAKLPEDDPDTIITRARLDLAMAYTEVWNGEFAKANDHVQHSIATLVDAYGDNWEGLIATYMAAGDMAWELGELQTASDHFARSMNLAAATYGPDNPFTDVRRISYAHMLVIRGELDRAAAILEPALARLRTVYDKHTEIAAGLHALGMLRRRQHRPDEARRALVEGATIYAEIYGPSNLGAADLDSERAKIFLDAGDLDQALSLEERVHTQRIASLGPDHLWVGDSKLAIAEVLIAKNELDRADPLLADALAIAIEEVGPDHYYTAVVQAYIARVDLARGNTHKAAEALRRARAVVVDSQAPPETLVMIDEALARAR